MSRVLGDLVRRSPLMSKARALSAWVGTGKAVTAKGVLRRADVAPAVAALGMPAPAWVRSAADLAALHRPWVAAEAIGLLTVGADEAVAATPPEHDATTQWLVALRAVLRSESRDDRRIGATLLCRAVLQALDTGPVPDANALTHAVTHVLHGFDTPGIWAAYEAFGSGFLPVPAAVELLAEARAVDATTMTPTPLGRWAGGRGARSPSASTRTPTRCSTRSCTMATPTS